MRIKLVSSLLSLLVFVMAYGQAPQLMNYQAVVRDTHGNPEAGATPVVLTFIIHDGSTTGNPVYTETQSTTTNALGLVNVQIGSVNPLSIVTWGSGAKYLEVQANINGSGNVSMGNSQLISVPYALYAANSNTGPAGPTGAQGGNGVTGAAGATGLQGATGATGSNGITGATGASGNDGTNGSNGTTGPGGADGANGTDGATGLTGPSGADGSVGATGTTGASGTDGTTGPTGPSGIDGSVGATGASGMDGSNGNAGATGATGASGTAGTTGTSGTNGATGATGFLTPGTAANNTPYWNGTQWVVSSSNISNDGTEVGIGGPATPSYMLQVYGRIKTFGINETSDERLKKEISTLNDALKTVEKLRGVTYNWKTQGELDKEGIKCKSPANANAGTKHEIGLIAQEVEKIIPDVVCTDKDGFKSVEYTKLVALLIEALKEQQGVIEKLKVENDVNQQGYQSLQNENKDIRATLKSIQQYIGLTSGK